MHHDQIVRKGKREIEAIDRMSCPYYLRQKMMMLLVVKMEMRTMRRLKGKEGDRGKVSSTSKEKHIPLA